MKNCNETKAHIDNFGHIDKQQREAVCDHIAICEECADYKTVADSTADLLGSLGKAIKQMPLNEQVYQKTQARAKKDRRATAMGFSGMVLSVLALLWFYAQGGMALEGLVILGGWAIGSGVYGWWSSRKVARFGSVSASPSQRFLADWAKDLMRQIKVTTVVAAILSLEIVFFLSAMIVDGFAGEGALVLLGVNAVLAIGVTYAFAVELPGLKNELALIKEDV